MLPCALMEIRATTACPCRSRARFGPFATGSGSVQIGARTDQSINKLINCFINESSSHRQFMNSWLFKLVDELLRVGDSWLIPHGQERRPAQGGWWVRGEPALGPAGVWGRPLGFEA